MARPRVFLTHNPEDLREYFAPMMERLHRVAEVKLNSLERNLSSLEVVQQAADCDIIVAHRSNAGDATVFQGLPRLCAFLRAAFDLSTVDVEAASECGVLVCHAEKSYVVATAELVLGLMLDLARHVSRSSAAYWSGEPPEQRIGLQLRGSTAGILGYGAIGRYLAALLGGLGMEVLISDPAYEPDDVQAGTLVSAEQCLSQADFVVPLVSLSSDTKGLIGTKELRLMKNTAYLINASRGQIVHEAALAEALRTGVIAGAGMDVGLADDQRPSPDLVQELHIVATPHLGGLTPENAYRQSESAVEQVEAIAAGRIPPRSVNLNSASRLSGLLRKGRSDRAV